jgi:chromosome segregation ATPase
MNRCLKSNKDNLNEMTTLEKMLADERAVDKDQRDHDYVLNLERQLASLRASQEALNRDYRELQSKKASMLREMKGTREQRIKRLEDSKQSFTSWVAHLIQDPETLKRYGIEMEKMRLAMMKERERLSAFHQYEDGQIDQPFLTPDTAIE